MEDYIRELLQNFECTFCGNRTFKLKIYRSSIFYFNTDTGELMENNSNFDTEFEPEITVHCDSCGREMDLE